MPLVICANKGCEYVPECDSFTEALALVEKHEETCTPAVFCPGCGEEVYPDSAGNCPACGDWVKETLLTCSDCGYQGADLGVMEELPGKPVLCATCMIQWERVLHAGRDVVTIADADKYTPGTIVIYEYPLHEVKGRIIARHGNMIFAEVI